MSQSGDSFTIRVLFDGECPLCAREIRFLERRDHGRGRVQFEDISAPGFDPHRYGLEMRDVMARIHGVLPNGDVVEGLEVFRQLYAGVGLGWLMAATRWPGIRRFAEWAYGVFARNRLRWTGRASVCDGGQCLTPPSGARHPSGGSRSHPTAPHPYGDRKV